MSAKISKTDARPNKRDVLVLLSGGIDSSTCLHYYLQMGFRAQALFVDYGQASSKKELRAARSVCGHFRTDLDVLRVTGAARKRDGLISGRNAFLLSLGAMECESKPGIIAIGIHSGTTYRDCSPQFVRQMQAVLNTSTDGSLQIEAPFLRWNKRDIWTFANQHGVPLGLTYSCERGSLQPCGRCASCEDLENLHASSQQQA